ncbi:restriction endonuclease [Streptomyces piniterrae]|uniref:Restriction endonuclease n=1 Tax=Streptomyces piniterrae TaxID=2571125 RepID=A0A4U0NU28_9ACTN|nr:restriction endonuclease [Streptomyces piniterrae]
MPRHRQHPGRLLPGRDRTRSPRPQRPHPATRAAYRCAGGLHQALIVTTSSFTPDAQRANAELDHPLRLVDGRALGRWVSGGRPPWLA